SFNNPFIALTPEEQLGKMLDFAQQYGYTTIYFEALDYSNAMYRSSLLPVSPWVKDSSGDKSLDNPLKTLAELCRERELLLVAVVNPFKIGREGKLINEEKIFAARNEDYYITAPNGEMYYNISNENVREYIKRIIEELSKRYDVDGILLEGLNMPGQVRAAMGVGAEDAALHLLDDISDILKKEGNRQKLAVEITQQYSDDAQSGIAEEWINAGLMDTVVLNSSCNVLDDSEEYEKNLVYWKTLADITGVGFTVRLSAEDVKMPSVAEETFANGNELFLRQYVSESNGITAYVCSGYRSLNAEGGYLAKQLKEYSPNNYPNVGDRLVISRSLKVTRPTQNISWNAKNYFIMGTSDPTVPLYCNGEAVERFSESGIFGILVDVPIGKNEYVFTQNEHVDSVTITREDPNDTATHITNIRVNSVFPQVTRGVKAGETIKLECIAPSNAKVTANINGERVVLEQIAATAEAGIPARYTVEYKVPTGSYPAQKVTNAGKITYRVEFRGSRSTVESPGELLVVGEKADFVIRAEDYHTNVYYDTAVENEFLTTLRRGALDYVVACTNDGYYELASGGFVPVKSVKVVTDGTSPKNTVSEYSVEYADNDETIVLSGTAGTPSHTELADGKLTVKLFNTSGITELNMEDSTIVEGVDVEYDEENNVTTLIFNLKKRVSLWGYSVEYNVRNLATIEDEAESLDVSQTVIYLSKAPKLSSNKLRPLEGIVVSLDAGHGGTDPGALGFGGVKGPTEADLNYVTALFVKSRLEELGARVMLFAEIKDEKMELDARNAYAADIKPDLFISLHHNSTAETKDSHSVSGTAVYYHFEGSKAFAENIANMVSGSLARENDGALEGYFYVTRMSAQPSVLVELAYMVNPLEYEQCCNELELCKTAYAIAEAVTVTIRNFE
ncbi:MAG: N-acetylmuramoyl-L-alanine amidase, partial [Oscillospiraceae bacterium]|nr:N-acetylmuramoyl-L-alanine amidase [Oscillospiraceae bacterium]